MMTSIVAEKVILDKKKKKNLKALQIWGSVFFAACSVGIFLGGPEYYHCLQIQCYMLTEQLYDRKKGLKKTLNMFTHTKNSHVVLKTKT